MDGSSTKRLAWLVMALLAVGAGGCGGGETPVPTSPSPSPLPAGDVDGDGFSVEDGDCDDSDAASNPGAQEIAYDGVDQDCSGADLSDVDGDGYDSDEVSGGDDCDDTDVNTNPGASELADDKDNDCNGQVDDGIDTIDDDNDGFSEADNDCDDTDPGINPDAEEQPYNGVDEDCSGADLTDVDGDTYSGGPRGEDCLDTDANTYPGAGEVPYDGIDQDCDGQDLTDKDGDGAAGGPDGTDCNDEDPLQSPLLTEVPYDGIDNDCDGTDLTDVDQDGEAALEAGGTDCNDQDNQIFSTAEDIPYDGVDQDCSGSDLIDVDGDTHAATQAGGDDCDDQDANTFPGNPEFLDGKDNDCNGSIDDGLNTSDDDGDGQSEAQGDCNDARNDIYLGATEIPYDGIDQDCSGRDLTDVDGDTYDGGPQGNDCNDNDPTLNPGAEEVPYDGIDQDCSGADLVDVDKDGSAAEEAGGEDCDDDDPLIHPSASEIPYDAIDQDCSGTDLTDVDGDGFDSTTVEGGTDCNDANPALNPGADEVCDQVDNNCDTVVDTDAVDRPTWYLDGDHDTYGDPAQPTLACEGSETLVSNGSDCDDSSAANYPGATETCDAVDNDCDTQVDEDVKTTFYADADTDGYANAQATTQACTLPEGYLQVPASPSDFDCDDTRNTVYPGAPESCDLLDNDCDSAVDEDVQNTYYLDADGDTYGNASKPTKACSAPEGYVSDNTDCKDTSDSVYPGAQELCNNLDDNCNSQVDEDAKSTWYHDVDGDGYGNAAESMLSCTVPSGYVSNSTDCDDTDIDVHPGAAEVCNSVDDNCKNGVDEGVLNTYYLDSDSDGYGSSTTTQACSMPSGYASNSQDCNDASASVKPGATEVCNGVDDNCMGGVDEGVKNTYYLDSDGDGFGSSMSSTQACSAPTGYVSNNQDCNDASASVKPSATEICNGADDNCNSVTDEGVQTTYYQDSDADTYGNTTVSTQACSKPSGYAVLNGDCNDSSASINPAATEVCDSANTDENCNGKADDLDSSTSASTKTLYYNDADQDTYGDKNGTGTLYCDNPSTASVKYVTSKTDCNDSNAGVNPGATEACDGVDTNCDSTVPSNEADADSDGQRICAGDCDDTKSAVKTGGTEICDTLDNNCDGSVDNLSSGTSCQRFNGTFGTSWETMANPTNALYSLQSYHSIDMAHIYNFYSNSSTSAQKYSTTGNTWANSGSTMPYNQPWASAAPWQGSLYLIRNSNIYRYVTSTETWSTVKAITGGDDYNMTESDEFGHIYGHTTSGQIVDYDTASGSVNYYTTGLGSQYETRMGYDPGTRALYIGAYNAPYLYKFNLTTKAVTQLATIPESQLNDIFCSDRSGHIYVAGASGGTTLFQYDIATNVYKALPALPSDHGNNGSCTVSETGYLYVGTGSNMKLHRLRLY